MQSRIKMSVAVSSSTYRPAATPLIRMNKEKKPMNWESHHLLGRVKYDSLSLSPAPANPEPVKLGKKWKEYQGARNWAGLLNPLDRTLREEILRYGSFVDAAYRSFDSDASSSRYGDCKYAKRSLLAQSGMPDSGYKITRNLYATSKSQMPGWFRNPPHWMATRSSWIGYVAVCMNKKEIARLGRRDVVIALRGTCTSLEWLENFRANLTEFPSFSRQETDVPMVETGFLNLYCSRPESGESLQDMVVGEIEKTIETYRNEPLSITLTGHSLGAALAILGAFDIKSRFHGAPIVTVISFGGPRVGDRNLRRNLENQGVRILRIVNSDDVVTRLPGFLVGGEYDVANYHVAGFPAWILSQISNLRLWYDEVGQELPLSGQVTASPHFFNGVDFATCHDLKTYLQLIGGAGASWAS